MHDIPQRLIAIGDIHGQHDMLRRLLNVVCPTVEDQLVFLGDYIDRGKESREVIERLIEFQVEFPKTIFLRGNHDQLLLDAMVEMGIRQDVRLKDLSETYQKKWPVSDLELFFNNGGCETLNSYGLESLNGFPLEHIQFLENTKLWWTFEYFTFVHAGLESNVPLGEQDLYTLLWSRCSPAGKGVSVHVVGHSPTCDGEPYFEQGRYSLDTGAGYDRSLTACDMLTKQVWQVMTAKDELIYGP